MRIGAATPRKSPDYQQQFGPQAYELPKKEGKVGVCGAVSGIHVGVDEQGPFRNKNGVLLQSVIASCSFFDMKFHYVLAGWEDLHQI
ncbi:hypothetical protein Tco_1295903 [Tanacetum coccineum]